MKTKIELIITLFLISALIPILFLSRCNAQDFDAEVKNYRTTHEYALSLTLEVVKIEDEDVVENAIESFDLLSQESQKILEPEKVVLDSLSLAISKYKALLDEIQTFKLNNSKLHNLHQILQIAL